MRVGEAIALDCSDLDGVLVVRGAKLRKSRELPLHPTTVQALTGYLGRRDRPTPPAGESALLVSTVGTRLLITNVQVTFRTLRARAGIQTTTSGSPRPTIHGLRHSFAVRTILDGYRIWLKLVAIAHDLIVWTQQLILTGELARCEPKRLRYRPLHVAARLAFHVRKATLRIHHAWPGAAALTEAFTRARALAQPA